MSAVRQLLFAILASALAASTSLAYQVELPPLVDQAGDAVAVVRATVIEGVIASIPGTEGQAISCGYDYRVRIAQVLQGGMTNGEIVQFRSMDNLSVGGDYLILLGRHYLDAALAFTGMGRNRDDLRRLCENTTSQLFASVLHGEIFEFDLVAEAETGQEWLKVLSAFVNLPADVETDSVVRTGSNQIVYRLVEWSGLRAALEANLRQRRK
jgi:hypothetical protein